MKTTTTTTTTIKQKNKNKQEKVRVLYTHPEPHFQAAITATGQKCWVSVWYRAKLEDRNGEEKAAWFKYRCPDMNSVHFISLRNSIFT